MKLIMIGLVMYVAGMIIGLVALASPKPITDVFIAILVGVLALGGPICVGIGLWRAR